MNPTRVYIISIILFCSLSKGLGQLLQNFDLEGSINRSYIFNQGDIFSHEYRFGMQENEINITKESHSSTYNYGFSLGYRILLRHHIRLRYSRNSLGSTLTRNIKIFEDDLSSTEIILKDSYNRIQNQSLGILYELIFPISFGKLSMSLGGEKQWNNFEDILVIVPGINSTNFAIHSSLGYIYSLFKSVHLHGKLLAIRSFAKNQDLAISYNNSKYIPLQLGFEFAIRYNLGN